MRYVYANCLLFALWYWVRHPFSSRIVCRRRRNGFYPHFMVLTKTELIHLRSVRGGRYLGPLLFKGRIKRQPRVVYDLAYQR